jgi:hypothetical protein
VSDETRKIILARRARFVAAALATAALGASCAKQTGGDPAPCLSQPYQEDDGGPPPEPCLSPPPEVCLEPVGPEVCLSVEEPVDGQGTGGEYAKPPPGKS